MGKNLIEVLAQIHGVNWKALGLDRYLVVPDSGREPARREIERWENNLRDFRVGPEPVLAESLLWLKENMPATKKLTMVHGDYRLGNFIWNNDHIAAFLDWEMVGIGDPISDLAWICMRDWSPGDQSKVCNLLDKEDAYQYYQDLTGIPVDEDEVLYWKVLGHFKLAVIVICGVRAYFDKKNPDLRLLTISSTYLSQIEEIINLLNF
jgi:aminoglycoside phosphotransferase (APT) family kinase protein